LPLSLVDVVSDPQLPVSAPSILVSPKSIRPVNLVDLHAPSSVSSGDSASGAPAPGWRSAPCPAGEGGVEALALTDNCNTFALGGKILQSDEVKQDEANGGGVKVDEARSGLKGPESGVTGALKETKRSLQFRSPRGELEGKSGFSQAISEASEKLIEGSVSVSVSGVGGGWVEGCECEWGWWWVGGGWGRGDWGDLSE